MQLALPALLIACGTFTGKVSGGDSAGDTGDVEDTSEAVVCADVEDAHQIGRPLRRAEEVDEDEVAAIAFGQVIRPATVEAEAGVWLQASDHVNSYADHPEWSGVYLLDEEDWSDPVLPTRASPRFVAGPAVPDTAFALEEVGLSLSFGPEGEGLWFVQAAEDETEGNYTWRIFEGTPADATMIDDAPLTIENLSGVETPPADLDGDGLTDFVAAVGRERKGLHGYLAPGPGVFDVDVDSDFFIVDDTTGDGGVASVFAFADLDGDGYDDMTFVDADASLMVKAGPITHDATWTEVEATWAPTGGFESLGYGASNSTMNWGDDRRGLQRVPDLTGDGRDDVLVFTSFDAGTGGDDQDGLTVFLLDRLEPGSHTIDELTALRGLDDSGGYDYVELGGTGDFDGDGATDLFLKHASEVDGAWAGVVFLGPLADGVDPLSRRVSFEAPLAWEWGAYNAGVVGDLDGDGVTSWVFVERDGGYDPARAWLVEGCGQAED